MSLALQARRVLGGMVETARRSASGMKEHAAAAMAIASLMVAAAAWWTSLCASQASQVHDRLSVRPMIGWEKSRGGRSLTLYNSGLGPALIDSLQLFVRDDAGTGSEFAGDIVGECPRRRMPSDSLREEAGDSMCGWARFAHMVGLEYPSAGWVGRAPGRGDLLPNDQEGKQLLYATDSLDVGDREIFGEALERLEMRIVYESLYEEAFVFQSDPGLGGRESGQVKTNFKVSEPLGWSGWLSQCLCDP